MNLLRYLPAAMTLSLACAVTLGSLYVTVSAATVRQADEAAAAGETDVAEVSNTTLEAGPNDVVPGSDGTIVGMLGIVGSTQGSLDPATGLTVRLVRNGQIVQSSKSGVDGSYAFQNVTPGMYSIVAMGNAGLAAFGIRVVSAVPGDEPTMLHTAIVQSRDLGTVHHLISEGMSGGAASSVEPVAALPSVEAAGPSTTIRHQMLILAADGSLSGAIQLRDAVGALKQVSDLTISFVSGATIAATTVVAPDGSFTVRNLPPGVYSVVGAGADGVIATGAEVSDAVSVAGETGEYVPVNILQGGGFSGMPCPAGDFAAAGETPGDEEDDEEETPPVPPVPGGIGGVGSGGGGGGGGGGDGMGIGGLLIGGAVGAAIGYAVADDDDDRQAATGDN